MVRALPYTLAAACMLALALTGCARLYGESHTQELLDHPVPASEHDRAMECGRLIGEVAQQRKVGTDVPSMAEAPFTSAATREEAARTVKSLEARESELHCADVPASAYAVPATPAPAPAAVAAPAAPRLTPAEADAVFDRCFQRCRQYTDRSKEQCFDVCTK
jgi:hypothetical protein